MITGHVGPRGGLAGEDLHVTVFPVQHARWERGRWTRPGALSFGVCFAVQRRTIDRLGGWDERLGPGVPDFPAADDMDFNYRLLRAGGRAWLSPAPRAEHDQWRGWRSARLYRGYVRLERLCHQDASDGRSPGRRVAVALRRGGRASRAQDRPGAAFAAAAATDKGEARGPRHGAAARTGALLVSDRHGQAASRSVSVSGPALQRAVARLEPLLLPLALVVCAAAISGFTALRASSIRRGHLLCLRAA